MAGLNLQNNLDNNILKSVGTTLGKNIIDQSAENNRKADLLTDLNLKVNLEQLKYKQAEEKYKEFQFSWGNKIDVVDPMEVRQHILDYKLINKLREEFFNTEKRTKNFENPQDPETIRINSFLKKRYPDRYKELIKWKEDILPMDYKHDILLELDSKNFNYKVENNLFNKYNKYKKALNNLNQATIKSMQENIKAKSFKDKLFNLINKGGKN